MRPHAAPSTQPPATTGRGWLTLVALVLVVGLGASGFFYVRSRSADLGRHANVVAAFGALRHESEAVSTNVLLSRFGLANQYDGLTRSSAALAASGEELEKRIRSAIPVDAELGQALTDLGAATLAQRDAAERFKSENAILRNSLYYLPTAAQEVQTALAAREVDPALFAELAAAVERLERTSLVFGLIGDASSATANGAAIASLADLRGRAADDVRTRIDVLLSHARIVAERQPAADQWVARVGDAAPRERLAALERLYHARFGVTVREANQYRKILYGFSLVMLTAVVAAGIQLYRVYRGLELRVAERTEALGKALDSLWGEMRLARKIQEALVPAAPSMVGRDIAATMRPTDDVGGDYYDVIRVAGHEWILVGDVSGHGVPAGLVMMMCQTAVRTILRRDPDILPDQLLSMVNAVLTENIRRLGDNKYMTITALRFEPDGKVLYAGAHQDLFVYRAASGQVETLPTHGVWLGLREDIGSRLKNDRFSLGKDDVLMLFTDGVTEAMRDGSMFETRGIRRVLSRATGLSARAVLDALFDELAAYSVDDDATAIVVRQVSSAARHEVDHAPAA